MRLRDVEFGDVDAYVRMRCDPVMMAELGGPRPREGIEEKVRRDVQDVASGTAWIKMIVPSEDGPDLVAGTVALWSHDGRGELLSTPSSGGSLMPTTYGPATCTAIWPDHPATSAAPGPNVSPRSVDDLCQSSCARSPGLPQHPRRSGRPARPRSEPGAKPRPNCSP